MKSLENRIFRKGFLYRQKFINTCIMRIKYGHRSERTIRGYKMYVFKMMHDIIKKNICNFINLLTNGTECREIPEHDDVITDVYITFDKCIEKYKVAKGRKFYYYFNKSLSRNFYREYKKQQRQLNAEMNDVTEIYHPNLQVREHSYTTEVLMGNLCLSEIEKRVIRSRLAGQKTAEFLNENKDISNNQYVNALKRVKTLISDARENETW